MKEDYSNEDLQRGIRGKDHECLGFIYREFYPVIERFILKNSGTREDARDIFQEAMMVIYERLTAGYKLTNIPSYTYGVSRNLWLMKLRKTGVVMVRDTEQPDPAENTENACIQHERYELMQKHFNQLGEDCRKVLSSFFNGISLRDIADQMGYSEKYAKKRKFVCQKRLIQAIEADHQYRELIF